MEYRDMAGNEITVGSYIVYAIRSGNSADMKIGKVVELSTVTPSWSMIPRPIIHAVTVNRDWGNHMWYLQKAGRIIKLDSPDRMYVIENVPDEVKELLEG